MNKDDNCKVCPEGQTDYSGMCLPEVDFTTFVYSLFTTAMLHLGEIVDPETGRTSIQLPLAKHTIDTLAMLEEKTKGNLDCEETRKLADFLGHLRLLYVRKNG
jgi:hypothetical protein